MTDRMTSDITQDEAVVAPLVVDYYRYVSGQGGTSSDDLLALDLSPAQRRLLLERMDDVNVVFQITAPVRNARNQQRDPRAAEL